MLKLSLEIKNKTRISVIIASLQHWNGEYIKILLVQQNAQLNMD